MKKFLFLAIAATAFASCSQDEVMEVAQKQAIQFGEAFIGNATRAVDPSYTANNITSFKLFGTVEDVNIYNDVTIARDSKAYNEAWTQVDGTTQYWVADADYKFVAIVDGDKDNVTETTIVDGMPTSITYNADGETDLLCDIETRRNNTSLVGFTFTHLLSKVYFTFTNKMPAESKYTYKVSDVKITSGLYKSGTYTIEPAEGVAPWSLGTGLTDANVTTDDLSFGNIVADDNSTDAVNLTYDVAKTSKYARLILPGEQTLKVAYTLEILYDGESVQTYNKTADIKNTNGTAYNFLANYVYNIQGILQQDLETPIQFTVTAAPAWGNEEPEVITIQ